MKKNFIISAITLLMVLFTTTTFTSCEEILYSEYEHMTTPIPPAGEATKIVGRWGNATLEYYGSAEDLEDFPHEGSYFEFSSNGKGSYYNSQKKKTKSFLYIYMPNTNKVTLYSGPFGVVQDVFYVRFINDNKIRFDYNVVLDPTDYELKDYGYKRYPNIDYTLERLNTGK